jgi:hypothetical protein
MNFWEKLSNLGKKWIYLMISICVIVPLFFKFEFKMGKSPSTMGLYNKIESIASDSFPFLMSYDYDPSTQGELSPMAIAILRHAFASHKRVMTMALYPQGIGLAEGITSRVAKEFNEYAIKEGKDTVVYGVDYVVLPFTPGVSAVMLSIGESLKNTFATDYYGNLTDTLECLKNVYNYNQIPVTISLAGSALPKYWIMYAHTRYSEKIACGVTAVSAADFYPYLRTGQFVGMLTGLRGAAEYENLVRENYNVEGRDIAIIGMSPQSFAHIFIIFMIIVGNISYFIVKKQKARSV